MNEHREGMGAGALWSMLDNLAQQVLSFLVFLFLARMIAPEDFGLIAIAHVMVTLVRQTVFDAIVQPVTRSHAPGDALYSRAFYACLVVAIVIAILVASGARQAARFYRQPELFPVLIWMSVVIVATGAASVYESRLVRTMQFKPLAIRSIVSVAVGGGVGIALAKQGAGVMALVAQQVVTSCLALTMLIAQSSWRPRFIWSGLTMREFHLDASRVSLTGLFGFMTSQGDTVLVSIFLGGYATGIYSFAKRLTSAIYLVIGSSLLKIAIPSFAHASSNPVALRDAYVRVLGIALFLMAPLLAGLGVLADPVIGLFFGQVWAPAAPIVPLLSAMYLLLAANQINDYLLFAVGARAAPMQRTLLQIVLVLLLGVGSSGLGLTWTAAAFVAAGAAVWPWAQWLTNRYLHMDFLHLALALKSPVIATAGMTATLVLVMHYTVVTIHVLLALVFLGAVVYLAIHRLVAQLSPQSHNALHDLLHWRGVKRTG